MLYGSIGEAVRAARAGGPKAFLLCEDAVLAEASAAHLAASGFAEILAIGPGAEAPAARPGLARLAAPIHEPEARARLLTRLVAAHAGRWLLILFNGEFPFHPFAESRPAAGLTEFLDSERRAAAAAYTLDLYDDGMLSGAAPDLSAAWFDADGWYGFEREDGQAEVFGGLGWRFEDYAPPDMARIDRPALFRAAAGLAVGPDLRLSDPELNALSCPWHHSPTIALMSYRRTRRILAHPGMRGRKTLAWRRSERFSWRAEQLVRLGVIEEGQWF